MGASILKLQITGNSNYELDESDILNVKLKYTPNVNESLDFLEVWKCPED